MSNGKANADAPLSHEDERERDASMTDRKLSDAVIEKWLGLPAWKLQEAIMLLLRWNPDNPDDWRLFFGETTTREQIHFADALAELVAVSDRVKRSNDVGEMELFNGRNVRPSTFIAWAKKNGYCVAHFGHWMAEHLTQTPELVPLREAAERIGLTTNELLRMAGRHEIRLYVSLKPFRAKLFATPSIENPRTEDRDCRVGEKVPLAPDYAEMIEGFGSVEVKHYESGIDWHYWHLDEPQTVGIDRVYIAKEDARAKETTAGAATSAGAQTAAPVGNAGAEAQARVGHEDTLQKKRAGRKPRRTPEFEQAVMRAAKALDARLPGASRKPRVISEHVEFVSYVQKAGFNWFGEHRQERISPKPAAKAYTKEYGIEQRYIKRLISQARKGT